MKTDIEKLRTVQIALNIEVRCAGRRFGRCSGIVMDPDTCELTHLVVRDKGVTGIERMAPIYLVEEISPKHIELFCAGSVLEQLEVFGEETGSLDELASSPYAYGDAMEWPYAIPAPLPRCMQEYESVHSPTTILRKGTRVTATDGIVGRVNGLVAQSRDWQITHVTIQQNHPWVNTLSAIPISDVVRIDENLVCLKLSRTEFRGRRTVLSHRSINI